MKVLLTPTALLDAALLVVGVAVIALLPAVAGGYTEIEMVNVGVYFIAIIGLNVVSGYSGQISLGHGAFMGLGAYTTSVLYTKYDIGTHWSIPVAGVLAGLVGFLFGFPALRLTGVYLALATFGLAVAFISLAQSSHFQGLTGGFNGVSVGLPQTPYYLTWGIALGMFVAAWLILRGRFGRRFRAVRDAPIAAVSSGVNIALVKAFAFGLAALYGGVAGALYAISKGFVSPLAFPVSLSILLLTGAALAGFGSLRGSIFGAVFIEFAPRYGEHLSKEAPSVMYGLILLAILFVMPGGAAALLRTLLSLLKRVSAARYSRSAERRVAT
jgi:branched-chain amino acid transport system permease protein